MFLEFALRIRPKAYYVSDKELSGPNFYVDNSIAQMLSYNEYTRNLVRFSHFLFSEAIFNSLDNQQDVFAIPINASVSDPIEVILFRKIFIFRRLNPSPLSYLQYIPQIMPYLQGKIAPNLTNIYVKHIFHAIKYGLSEEMINTSIPTASFIYNNTNDLSVDIGVFHEYITTGKSATKEKQQKQEILKQFSLENTPEDDERYQEIMKQLNKEVEIDLHTISIKEHIEVIFQFSENQLMSLMPMLEGDVDLLDYPYKG
ncbi:hypothetical protein ACFLTU_08660 [Bacteroidota bacterium]